MRPRRTRIFLGIAIAIPVAFVVVQLVPYGRDHRNPPVVIETAGRGRAI